MIRVLYYCHNFSNFGMKLAPKMRLYFIGKFSQLIFIGFFFMAKKTPWKKNVIARHKLPQLAVACQEPFELTWKGSMIDSPKYYKEFYFCHNTFYIS